jgi:hypothetical protein
MIHTFIEIGAALTFVFFLSGAYVLYLTAGSRN